MVKEITVRNNEELIEVMENGSYEISKSIVENIIKHLNSKKKRVHVISIFCEEDQAVYDLTLERSNFLSTLKKNLTTFEQAEDFEGCIGIQNAINQLKPS
jgi:DUF438 domain-containing protein